MDLSSKESSAELKGSPLGDLRRNASAARIVDALLVRGGYSAARACGSWRASKSCYRLVDSPDMTHSALLVGHFAATAERARNLPEYSVTQVDLDSALARARRNVK